MKSIKFKLLVFVGIIVLIFSAILIFRTQLMVTANIENLIDQELTLALNLNLAIREYVDETICPLMFKLVDKDVFIPETLIIGQLKGGMRLENDNGTDICIDFKRI